MKQEQRALLEKWATSLPSPLQKATAALFEDLAAAREHLEVIERAVYDDNVVPPHCGHRTAVKEALKKLRTIVGN